MKWAIVVVVQFEKKILSCAANLQGEYGISGLYIGVA
jgi:malate/lactate dehydrogenase